MSTLKAGKLQHPDAANSSIEFDSSGNITKFVGPSGGSNGDLLTKSGTTTAWATPSVAGLTLIQAETFSAVSAVNLNNVFTSTYVNYQIVLRITAGSINDQPVRLRLRSSGTDASGTDYKFGGSFVTDAGVSAVVNSSNATHWFVNQTSTSNISHSVNWVYGPQLAAKTGFQNLTAAQTAVAFWRSIAGVHDLATAYDGFSIFADSGTITGNLRLYGLKD